MIKSFILNILDHFSKFSYSFNQKTKTGREVLSNLQIFIKKFGKPEIIQTDYGGEFSNKDLDKFCEQNGIKLIHGAPLHPQSQGPVEAFNNTFKKLLDILIKHSNGNFDLNNLIDNVINMYNNTIHSTTKISPINAFTNKDNKIIEQIIKNTEKSQKKFGDKLGLPKYKKCLLAKNIKLEGNVIKLLFNKKGFYSIPIIIDEGIDGSEYTFHLPFDILFLKKDIIYRANYKLIKECSEDVWEEIKSDYINT